MKFSLKIIFLLCLLCSAAFADTTEGKTSRKMTVEAPPAYKIKVGDEIELDIYSLPQLEKKYTVRVDGKFFHPAIGEVPAAGKTLAAVQQDVTKRLRKELRNPSYRMGLLTFAKNDVSVLGEVKAQGKFSVPPGATVLDLLALAGGLSEKADPEAASLLRSGHTIEIDLRPPGGETLQAATVEAGDVLYIHAGNRISVAGEVQKPGIYAVSRRSTNPVADALKAAGGAKSTAALRRVKLLRPTLPAPLEIVAMPDKDGLMPPDARKLEDGDTLVVPERQAVILGAVAKQGPVSLVGGESLFDVVSSGQLGDKADLNRIVVVRSEDAKAGRAKREEYNLSEYFVEKKDTTPVPIRDGDMVFVPTKGESRNFFEPTNLLQLIFLARTLLI